MQSLALLISAYPPNLWDLYIPIIEQQSHGWRVAFLLILANSSIYKKSTAD
jgi:hypothetical protein